MKKLILISAALASVTVLSGCKTVVVHRAHVPAVVVDSRHHHEDVHVVTREEYRRIPPQYRDRVVVKEKVVIREEPRRGRFQERAMEQHRKEHPPKVSRREEVHGDRHDARNHRPEPSRHHEQARAPQRHESRDSHPSRQRENDSRDRRDKKERDKRDDKRRAEYFR